MKYIRLMNGTQAGFQSFAPRSREDLQADTAFMREFSKELKDTGVFVSTAGLAFPNEATLVRSHPDGETITDGVFPESKEFLAGYWIIDVESAEDACRVAARLSQAPGRGGQRGGMPVEVRRVMNSVDEYAL